MTVLAIRTVRKHVKIGMRESEVKQLMRSALSAAGLTDIFSLVLFGGSLLTLHPELVRCLTSPCADNAALPHGVGSDRVLGKHDFILIDTGGALHGYHSDTTRVST